MLELITDSFNVGIQDDGTRYRITHKYNGLNTLHFEPVSYTHLTLPTKA